MWFLAFFFCTAFIAIVQSKTMKRCRNRTAKSTIDVQISCLLSLYSGDESQVPNGTVSLPMTLRDLERLECMSRILEWAPTYWATERITKRRSTATPSTDSNSCLLFRLHGTASISDRVLIASSPNLMEYRETSALPGE